MKSPNQQHGGDSPLHEPVIEPRIAMAALLCLALASGTASADATKPAPKEEASGIDWDWPEKDIPGDYLDQYRCETEPGRFIGMLIEDARRNFKAEVKFVGQNTFVTYPDGSFFVATYVDGEFRMGRPDGTMNILSYRWIPRDAKKGGTKGGKKNAAKAGRGVCQKDDLEASAYDCERDCKPTEGAKIKARKPPEKKELER